MARPVPSISADKEEGARRENNSLKGQQGIAVCIQLQGNHLNSIHSSNTTDSDDVGLIRTWQV